MRQVNDLFNLNLTVGVAWLLFTVQPSVAQTSPQKLVAPPVGNINVSNIDIIPNIIDLNTKESITRLLLRDAPVTEVLSLLARTAGLNLIYFEQQEINSGQDKSQQQLINNNTNNKIRTSSKISLDIKNESVQKVFNYVLQVSGLEARRIDRTILVGAKLPNTSVDRIVRTLRLNQVTVGIGLDFLVALGAETEVSRERPVTTVNTIPITGGVTPVTQSQTTTETKMEAKRVDYQDSTPLLRGLQIVGDERTNSITLIGNPQLVDIATSKLTNLDIRRRQVKVNLKIIDVNLWGIQNYNSSFSFGIGDNFFSNDQGIATFNFGNQRPFTGSGSVPASLGGLPNRFLAFLQAQVTNGNAKILTDPSLIVQEGQNANVKLTQQVIGQERITRIDTPGNSREERIIEKEEVGLTVNVRVERIDDNGFVSLSVAPVVKSPVNSESPGAGKVTLIAERSLNSGLIRLRDGQTLLLSGIIQDQDRTVVTKVPLLGDIPLLGALFRSTNKDRERREVIVLLTPRIIEEQS
ncbi:secretin and TonB N-terminal domain-containing protein [Cylindrospermopsis raciborskii]|uniref:PilQ(Type II and III secretion system protein) n=1 Tax=Cylindrospermopsis raciborskii CS-505 TaxID=533240 RepID=A0A853MHX7_9CYAN|nr:secretin and TonB N-terminal domain-containing protein [Cylindrospermopsis raciborskii]EFA70851.1 pilQ(type II and III secretion system protein) [Cylindrospermopsis raciborskii CS-505]OBU77237.1 pilQ(type II and III secretion system protein) [Cylindrospermopsis raciborskii CS-505]PNK16150.1 pilQ(type II and III secretion system protein) [Cylindrospermopsis raciborskii S01]